MSQRSNGHHQNCFYFAKCCYYETNAILFLIFHTQSESGWPWDVKKQAFFFGVIGALPLPLGLLLLLRRRLFFGFSSSDSVSSSSLSELESTCYCYRKMFPWPSGITPFGQRVQVCREFCHRNDLRLVFMLSFYNADLTSRDN